MYCVELALYTIARWSHPTYNNNYYYVLCGTCIIHNTCHNRSYSRMKYPILLCKIMIDAESGAGAAGLGSAGTNRSIDLHVTFSNIGLLTITSSISLETPAK